MTGDKPKKTRIRFDVHDSHLCHCPTCIREGRTLERRAIVKLLNQFHAKETQRKFLSLIEIIRWKVANRRIK